MTDYSALRLNMVRSQLRTNQITDERVLAVMQNTPREVFVPAHLADVAYVDEDLPLGNGRYLPEPLILARMCQAAAIKPDDVVLDIGCASGYSAAVLAGLAMTVVAVENDSAHQAEAARNIEKLGIANVVFVSSDLVDGHAAQAPYDVILIHGAVPAIPDALRAQLSDGGRLVAVVAGDDQSGHAVGRLRLESRRGTIVSGYDICDTASPALPAFRKEKEFVF